MRVLVTGNNGYIGTVMVPTLQAQGFEVAGLDSDLFQDCVFGDSSVSGAISKINYARKDIRDIQLSDLKGFDSVVIISIGPPGPLLDGHNAVMVKEKTKLMVIEFPARSDTPPEPPDTVAV